MVAATPHHDNRHEGYTMNFEEKARKVHGDKYSYCLVDYKNSKAKVTIFCCEHGPFDQTPNAHLNGSGCPKCGERKRHESRKLSLRDSIDKAREFHGEKYDYTLVEYEFVTDKVNIVCPVHGPFPQIWINHYRGQGCPKCGVEQRSESQSMTRDDFISRSTLVHGDKYDYSLVDIDRYRDKVTIICPEHGPFPQTCENHYSSGAGCPKCAVKTSKPEEIICSHLDRSGVSYVRSERSLIKPLELDIYIPDHSIAIEYNGLMWHSEAFGKGKNYHRNKTDLCSEKGVRLIHIWEDDFNRNQELELKFIEHQLGLGTFNRVYARKTEVDVDVSKQEVRLFLMENHVQGYTHHTTSIGLREKGRLVALACFTKRGNQWELIRYCTSKHVLGGLGKLMKAWGESCYTFCDISRFNGNSYVKAGFVRTSTLRPDYRYLVNGERQHKFLWRKERIKIKLPDVYDPNLTEKQMMETAQIPRIWDCGKVRYEFTP